MTNLARRRAIAAIACAFAAALASCASSLIESWSDPALSKVPFRKVLVVFQNPDADVRRELEDEMARDIPNATASYTLFPVRAETSLERVKERVRASGYDSVVIMHLSGVDRDPAGPGAVYVQPESASTLWGSWDPGWAKVYDPAYLRAETVVSITTRVYGVEQDKLVWSSRAESLNPKSLRSAIAAAVRDNAKATARALRAPG